MKVPFIDLTEHHKNIAKEMEEALINVLHSNKFIMGENVKELEKEIAAYLDVKHAIGCASGTDSLLLSLMSLKLNEGDEIITTPFTFFATAGCIKRAGGKPVFVDIDDTYNIDCNKIEEAITEKTKAIIPVHLFGRACNMKKLMEISEIHSIPVIEDCAQSIGAEYRGKKLGTFGTTGCISFFPTKNLGGLGDGGMVVTNNDEIADEMRMLRVHGAKPKYFHKYVGINSRLDEMQAAILRIKLKHIDSWNEKRINTGKTYDSLLQDLPVVTPAYSEKKEYIYHQYPLLTNKRDELNQYLNSRGISSGIYYPISLHLQECFEYLGYKKSDLPTTEYIQEQIFSLPVFPEITIEQIEYVVSVIRDFFQEV